MSKSTDDFAYSNPFDDGADINPFAYAAKAAGPTGSAPPEVPSSQRLPPPTVNSTPQTSGFTATTAPESPRGAKSAREQELERRIKELEERQTSVPYDQKPKNWPRCYPITRHNIEEDVTNPVTKRLVKFGYASWILHAATLTVNWIACLVCLVAPGNATDTTLGANFGISVVLWALCIPLSWVFWYRPLYSASISEKASMTVIFLCLYAINICFMIVMLIGPQSSGSTGFINMIQVFSIGKTAGGIACIISMAFWACDVALAIFLIIRVYWFFRGKNPGKQLQGEVASAAGQAIASNPQLAAQVAAGAINTAPSQQV